jgi:hypothetical protein
MNWNEIFTLINNHTNKIISFQWNEDYIIKNGYHLTEIKVAQVNSVDCGGKMNAWREIVLQLWEPENKQAQEVLTGEKFIQIAKTVQELMPLDGHLPVKIEFGNKQFETRQVNLNEAHIKDGELLFFIEGYLPGCKALDRGEACGPIKPKIKLSEIQNNSCNPSGGCC